MMMRSRAATMFTPPLAPVRTKQRNVTQNAGLNGTLLDENNLSYNIQQGYQTMVLAKAAPPAWSSMGQKGNANIGYNVSDNGDYQQVNYGLSGGLVAHAHGLTLSQPLGQYQIFWSPRRAQPMSALSSQPGIHTDTRGYAVVPYAVTYRPKIVWRWMSTPMADDVDIDDAVTRVVPTEGALVLAALKRGSARAHY
ncbi:outer membrane usher protein FimD [Salmonella enterica subsp. arizonae]|uniref:Outer membrane usher protein FimD n=1 Tax=Salmonella enterica subsp. arizonae TaxID=59203 RepID=A0A379S806_SALER|nr:outer membrane usher protein FimD [Salmonella enterica subsp. arizonae]